MKKETKKLSKKTKLTLISIAVGLIFITAILFIIDSFAPANPKVYHRWVLSTFSGSFDGEDTPNTYQQMEVLQDVDEESQVVYSCIDTKVTTTNQVAIKEIWINISDLYNEELSIFISKGIDTKTTYIHDLTLSKKDIKSDKDGWFRIYYNENGLSHNVSNFFGQIKIGFSANVKFREMVVVDINGNLGSIEVKGRSIGAMPNKDGTSITHKKTDLGDAKNIADEKNTFKN